MRSPPIAAARTSAAGASTGLERDGGLAHSRSGGADVDDLGDPGDAILEDPLESRLQGDRRRRTRHARSGELDLDQTGGLVDVVEHDVAVVGLDGRPDHLEDLLDLFAHAMSLGSGDGRTTIACETRPMTTMVLAHQGGWDEALMVLVPIGVLAALLTLATRRARAQRRRDHSADDTGEGRATDA